MRDSKKYEQIKDHWDEKNETRKKVLEVFREMRKLGFIAKANFKDCNTCAGFDIACQAEKMVGAGRKVTGGMFWHHQAEASFWVRGELYISYGILDTVKFGEVGLPTIEIGKLLSEALRKKGLIVEWDDNPEVKILVKAFRREKNGRERTG